MSTDKASDKLCALLARAERLARPPYKRHSAQRLAAVHAIHSEIGKLMMAELQAEREQRALYAAGGQNGNA